MAERRPIIPAQTAIETFRDSGYRNTASAVAELIDNSIEAGANDIQVLTFEERHQGRTRDTYRIAEIAVYDNGGGMDKKTLALSLQFGAGTRMSSREGIGRFGIGLPNASVSQCRRVDIYSWQKGRCYWTYLDIDEIKEKSLQDARPVEECEMPDVYLEHIEGEIKKSGTIVAWSECDRLDLRRSATLFKHMQGDLCRIYRHFLDDDNTYGKRRSLKLIATGREREVWDLKANDPLYVMTPNSTPGHETEATNVMHGNVEVININYVNPATGRKKTSKVEIRYSMALPQIQALGGNSVLGQHYRENTGISFMRAAREIDFGNFGFYNEREERQRWWGCEVRFEPVLDELFGVTNNKQSLRGIRFIDKAELRRESADWEERLADDYRLQLNIALSNSIGQNIRTMMKTIEGRGSGRKGKTAADRAATDMATKIADGRLRRSKTKTDTKEKAKDLTNEQKQEEWRANLQQTFPELKGKQLDKIAREKTRLSVEKQFNSWPGAQFFSRERVGETCILLLNRRHPFYQEMYEELSKLEDTRYISALDLLLLAYIRMEDELYGRVEELEEIRETWGKHVRDFLSDLKKEV